ncbi:MAG: HAD family hydrolase [Rhizobiales bacterium]|nr:HAD family hydrolase [Hyphomicrobiales bacterium]
MPFTPDHHWYDFNLSATKKRGPGLFLDRDGVIIEDRQYISNPEDVAIIPGSHAAIQRFRDAGFRIVIISNQSGIGRGYYGWDEALAVQTRVQELAAQDGIIYDGVVLCPHHPEKGKGEFSKICDWRKPGSGMLTFVIENFDVDLGQSIMVGDKRSDIEAGIAAGIGRLVHVSTGHGQAERLRVKEFENDIEIEFADCLGDLEP